MARKILVIFKMSTRRRKQNPGKGASKEMASLKSAKAAFVALLLVALLAVSVNTEFAQIEPAVIQGQGNARIIGDTIILPGRAITGSATGPIPVPDPGSMHVLYWILLAVALIPLELELRKRNV